MHSYKNLAVVALAASFVSPALSAPTRERQQQSRAELEERGNKVQVKVSPGIAVSPMYPRPCLLPPCYPAYPPAMYHPAMYPGLMRSLGTSKRTADTPESRAIAELEGRTPGFSGEEWAALADHEVGQRDVDPQVAAVLNALAERADDPPEDSEPVTVLHLLARALGEDSPQDSDPVTVLHLLSRALDELD